MCEKRVDPELVPKLRAAIIVVIPGWSVYVSVGKNNYAPLFLVLEKIYGYVERAGGEGGSRWFGMCHWIVWMSCPPCQYKPPLLSSHYCLVIQTVHVCDGCKATRAFFFLYVSGLSLSAASELCNDWSRVCVCVWGRFYSAWGVSQSVPSMVVADCFYTTSCSENLQ